MNAVLFEEPKVGQRVTITNESSNFFGEAGIIAGLRRSVEGRCAFVQIRFSFAPAETCSDEPVLYPAFALEEVRIN